MRTPIAFALTATAVLSGCTVIPPADPARMRPAYAPPPPVRAPAPVAAPAPTYAPQPYAAPQAYTAAPPAYTPPSPPPADQPAPLTYAALNQTVRVDGPTVTPLQVLEDSRCPMNARCVWAGHVRLRVRIDSGTGGTVELTSGKPITVAEGTLELVEVRPDKVTGGRSNGAVKASDYRFGLRFLGGY